MECGTKLFIANWFRGPVGSDPVVPFPLTHVGYMATRRNDHHFEWCGEWNCKRCICDAHIHCESGHWGFTKDDIITSTNGAAIINCFQHNISKHIHVRLYSHMPWRCKNDRRDNRFFRKRVGGSSEYPVNPAVRVSIRPWLCGIPTFVSSGALSSTKQAKAM